MLACCTVKMTTRRHWNNLSSFLPYRDRMGLARMQSGRMHSLRTEQTQQTSCASQETGDTQL